MFFMLICIFSFQMEKDTETIYNYLQTSPQQAIQKVRNLGLTPFTFGQKLIPLGPDKAIAWFRAMEEADPEEIDLYRYGVAWVFYTENKIGRSERTLRSIVIKNPTNGVLNARIAYLFGHIELNKGNLKKASSYLDESLNLYHKEGMLGGQSNCLYTKGRVALLDDRLSDAQMYYDQAAKLDSQRNAGEAGHQIHLGNALIKMDKGEYQQAISLLDTVLKKIPVEEHAYIQTLKVNKALCYAYVGDLVKASEIAISVDTYLESHGGKQNYLNPIVSVSWYLIYKKRGWPTEEFEKTITDWIDNHEGSFELEDLFQGVKENH